MRTSITGASLAVLVVALLASAMLGRTRAESASGAGHLVPGVPSIYLTQARLDAILAHRPLSSPSWRKLKARAQEVDEAFHSNPAPYAPYYGPEEKPFLDAANAALANLPYLGLTCIVDGDFCDTGKRMLLNWASASPNSLHFDNPTEENLSLGRYMGQIAEGYALLASRMSPTERTTVTGWIRGLGYTIQRSQQYWYVRHAALGPQNHITWGEYGMAVAGLVANDHRLVDYAFSDPENGERFGGTFSLRTFSGLLQDAVSANGSPTTFFHEGVRPGELVDRDRHIHCGHALPNGCGLGYSMFSLSALAYTAYLADINGITDHGHSYFSETNARSNASTPVLESAMGFYANVLANEVNNNVVTDPGYAGEAIECGNLGGLLVGASAYPSIRSLLPKIVSNCQATSSDPQFPLDSTYPLNGISLLYLSVVFDT